VSVGGDVASAQPCLDSREYIRWVGGLDTPGRAVDLVRSGEHLFVADETALRILDVSSPLEPREIAWVPDLATEVALMGDDHAVLGCWTEGDIGWIVTVDVSDPSAPEVVGLAATGWILDLAVQGHYAYVAGNYPDFTVVDLSDPRAPVVVATLNLSPIFPTPAAGGIAVEGDFAYLSVFNGGVAVFDISDPAHPRAAGVLNLWLQTSSGEAAVSGRYLYMAGQWEELSDASGLWIIDVANPGAPVVAGIASTAAAADVVLAGDLALVADKLSGLAVVDIRDGHAPEVRCLAGAPSVQGVALAPGFALLAGHGRGVQVIDLSHLDNPEMMGEVSTTGDSRGLAVSGALAVLADGDALDLVDVTDPQAPRWIASLATPGNATEVAVQGEYAYVADSDPSLTVVDISDPAQPSVVGSIDTPNFSNDVAIAGSHAYVAYGNGFAAGLAVIDVGDPSAPRVMGQVSTPERAEGVAVSGAYAYVTSVDLYVVDVSDPAAPAIVNVADLGNGPAKLAVEEGFLYVVQETSLEVFDLSDPAAPVPVCSVPLIAYGHDVCLEGNFAYVSDGYFMHVVDISVPTSATRIGTPVQSIVVHGVAVSNGCLCTIHGAGLMTWPIQCDVPSSVSPPSSREGGTTAAGGACALRIAPNPAAGVATLRFALGRATAARVEVFDVAGRLRRTIGIRAPLRAGQQEILWDRRDDAGRLLAPGRYVIRVRAGDAAESAPIVLLP